LSEDVVVVGLRRLSIEVEGMVTEAVDVLRQIRVHNGIEPCCKE